MLQIISNMTILLIAATSFEIAPIIDFLKENAQKITKNAYFFHKKRIEILITGVGIAHTVFALTDRLSRRPKPDIVLNMGIAGAFDRKLQLGEVVQVTAERFGDLGVEEIDGRFIDMFELNFISPHSFPFENGILNNPFPLKNMGVTDVTDLTVQKVHGTAISIQLIQQKYPDIQTETMEGAAFFFVCLQKKVAFSQIRAISNYVEPRNRDAWKIGLAIAHLNEAIKNWLIA
jgi:futalosine hydrolase